MEDIVQARERTEDGYILPDQAASVQFGAASARLGGLRQCPYSFVGPSGEEFCKVWIGLMAARPPSFS